ncbi:hypothetical protein BDF22DRAFT_694650 [Syncephalis plumigaleata]|nr:hypothetical protein BDF22DRAFT_694650 [Syncephalis plumigaleata]
MNQESQLGEAVAYEDSPLADYFTSIDCVEDTQPVYDRSPSSWTLLWHRLVERWHQLIDVVIFNARVSPDERLVNDMNRLLQQSDLLSSGPSSRKAKVAAIKSGISNRWIMILNTLVTPLVISSFRHGSIIVGMSILIVHLNYQLHWQWYSQVAACIGGFAIITYLLSYMVNRLCIALLRVCWIRLLDNAHCYQSIVSKLIRSVQEMELVARGYQLNGPLPPISRIEKQVGARYGMEIRFLVCQSLRMIASEWTHAHSSMCLLYQVLNDYDVSASLFQTELDTVQDLLDTTGTTTSTSEMEDNSEALSLHTIRKMVQAVFDIRSLCLIRAHSVLVVMINRHHRNQQRSWHLEQFHDAYIKHQLISHLTNLSDRIRDNTHPLRMTWYRQHYDTGINEESQSTSDNDIPSNDDRRPTLQQIALLQQHLRVMQTKLMLTRNDVLSLPQSNDAPSSDEVAMQLDNLRDRLHEMHTETQIFMQNLEQTQQLIQKLNNSSNNVHPMSNPNTTNIDHLMPMKQKALDEDMISTDEIEFDWLAPRVLEPIGDEELFEAVASRNVLEDGKKMTREERIAMQQERREQEAQQKVKAEEATRLVYELKHVLDYRKLERHPTESTSQASSDARDSTEKKHDIDTRNEAEIGSVNDEKAWSPRSQPTYEQHSLLSELKGALKAGSIGTTCQIVIKDEDVILSDHEE